MPRPPLLITTPEAVMDAALGAITIGVIPVLGGLHAGHIDIIQRAIVENDEVVVAMLDLNAPVSEQAIRDAHQAGARVIYKPDADTMFPEGATTLIQVNADSPAWHQSRRPEETSRVATMVAVLMNQLQPTRTYIGEKDWVQLRIFQTMHRDLSLSGEIVPCPIMRDPDGLPHSTYNHLLSDEGRASAALVSEALFGIQRAALGGETRPSVLLQQAGDTISAAPGVTINHLAIVDPESLRDVESVHTDDRAVVTAEINALRIVDNVHLVVGR